MRKLLTIIMTLFVVYASGQGINERYVRARERLETNLHFIYQGNYIPAKDITYHEFSADSTTWRKNYVAGDCYVRFANTTANITNPYYSTTGYHNNWWVLNFCTLNGALDSIGNSVDSIFVHYYQSDTIYVTDTVIVDDGIIDIKIPAPDTITGNTGNAQDTAYHTHQVYLFLNDLENVDATPTDGQVLKYNSITGKWQAANDLVGGGGSSLKVKEIDDSPSINNVLTIAVSEGHLTNLGSGEVFLDLTLDPHLGANDYWRSDTVRVDAGDTNIEFSSPLPDDSYIIASLYAMLDNGGRQDLQYDSITDIGFKVLDVIDSAWVHYIAIRNVDSLLAFVSDVGKVLASPTDTVLTYLSSKTDDSTITVVDNELHVMVDDTTMNASLKNVYVESLNVGSINYVEPYYDDMSISLMSAAPGAEAPDLEAFRGSGIYAMAFAGTVVDETLYVESQLTHRIKDSSDVYIHLHVSPSTTPAATDTAVVQIEYIWGKMNAVFPTSTTITHKIPLGGKLQWEHMYLPVDSVPAIGGQASSIFMARITRLQSDTSDNYANDLFVFNFDLHFLVDSPGDKF